MKKIVEIFFIIAASVGLVLSVADVIFSVAALGFAPLAPVAVIIFIINAAVTAILLASCSFFITNKILRIAFVVNLISAVAVIASAIIIFCFV